MIIVINRNNNNIFLLYSPELEKNCFSKMHISLSNKVRGDFHPLSKTNMRDESFFLEVDTDANQPFKTHSVTLLPYFNALCSKLSQPQSHPYRTDGSSVGQVPCRQD